MAKQDELATALRDLLREVRKINDVLLPDGFDARAVRNAEIALAAHGVSVPGDQTIQGKVPIDRG